MACSFVVRGPRLPLPIARPSSERIGTTSAAVPVTKILLRGWAQRHLPKDHLYRHKRGFHVPVDEWLSGTFLDQVERKLLRNTAISEWFRLARLPEPFQVQRTQRGASREIFSLLQFAIWHRLFIEQPGLQPLPTRIRWISSADASRRPTGTRPCYEINISSAPMAPLGSILTQRRSRLVRRRSCQGPVPHK